MTDLQALLRDLDTALEDWRRFYEHETATEAELRETMKRVTKHGGTLAYIAELRERIRRAK